MWKLRYFLCGAGVTALLSMPANGAVYLLNGLSYSPYEYAQLIIELKEGPVAGELRPLRGDLTPSVKVTGTNTAPGVVELAFHLPSGPQTATFKKSIQGDKIRWESPGKEDDKLSFYRPSRGQFSDYALTLYHSGCGPSYKDLQVTFDQRATLETVNKFIEANPGLAKLQVKSYVGALLKLAQRNLSPSGDVDYKSASLGTDLRDRWTLQVETLPKMTKELQDWYNEFSRTSFPIGSELYFTEKARQSGLFRYVNLAFGGCGGAERSFFALERKLLFEADKFSKVKFQTFIEKGLASFAQQDRSGKKWNFRLAQQTIRTLAVPPYSSSYRVKVYVASEISRRKIGEWDSFYVSFDPTELETIDRSEYAIVVTVERLKASKRSSGSDTPPDDSYFKRELDYEAEAEVTTAVSYHFSRRTPSGWCHYEAEGIEPRKVKCDSR